MWWMKKNRGVNWFELCDAIAAEYKLDPREVLHYQFKQLNGLAAAIAKRYERRAQAMEG